MKELTIPRNTLVVLSGPAGCGKSTWASRHFWASSIISSDHCRELVSDDAANQQATPQAFQVMNCIIENRLELGRLTVADATSLKAEDRQSLLRIAEKFNFNSALVVFNIPIEVCLARNANRERVVPDEAVLIQHKLLNELLRTIDSEPFDLVYVLDEKAQSEGRVRVTPAISLQSARPLR